ncbi:11192_t:CDS:1, partial [Racocetra persica]
MNLRFSFVILILASIGQILADDCKHWRITSPTEEGLIWTAGQSYAVSWDGTGSKVQTVDKVDLYNDNDEFVVNEWQGPVPVGKLWTENFPLQAPDDGLYYFKVTATSSSGGKCFFGFCQVYRANLNTSSKPSYPLS